MVTPPRSILLKETTLVGLEPSWLKSLSEDELNAIKNDSMEAQVEAILSSEDGLTRKNLVQVAIPLLHHAIYDGEFKNGKAFQMFMQLIQQEAQA